MELGHRGPVAFQAGGEESVHRQQQKQVQRQGDERCGLDLLAVLDQPFLAEKVVDRQPERHPQPACEDRGALADARGEERLQSFNHNAKQDPPAECPSKTRLAGGGRHHAKKDTQRRDRQDFQRQLRAALERAAARRGDKERGASGICQFLGKLGRGYDEVERKQREAEIRRSVQNDQCATAGGPALQHFGP